MDIIKKIKVRRLWKKLPKLTITQASCIIKIRANKEYKRLLAGLFKIHNANRK